MRSFYRNRYLENLFQFLKLFTTFMLFYHSSFFPIFLQSFSYIYALSIAVFSNSFFAFLILNAIIFFLYIHSNRNGNVSSDHTYNRNQNQFLKITVPELVTDPAESPPEKQKDPVVETSLENQHDSCNSEVRESSPVFKETVTAVTESTTTTMTFCTTVTTSGDDRVSVSEEKFYRRVLSECYERRCVVADERREMKRFNTCLKKEPQRQLCYVEKMSKEEFNRTVEEFIAKHKRMQREEHEQLRSKKTQYLALAS